MSLNSRVKINKAFIGWFNHCVFLSISYSKLSRLKKIHMHILSHENDIEIASDSKLPTPINIFYFDFFANCALASFDQTSGDRKSGNEDCRVLRFYFK